MFICSSDMTEDTVVEVVEMGEVEVAVDSEDVVEVEMVYPYGWKSEY